MKISGIIKTSLIDYPGQITTSLFTQGCNFRCPYCHNPDLIPVQSEDDRYMDLEYLWDFLRERRDFLDAVTITGGEPTMQSDIVEIIREIKDRGFNVKLDTNGSRPDIVEELIQRELLDYVALDVKGSPAKYAEFTTDKSIAEKIIRATEVIRESGIEYEFRTTVVPGLHNKREMENIGDIVAGCSNYVIQNFRADRTYRQEFEEKTPFSDSKLEMFKEIIEEKVDTVTIKNN